MTPRDGLFSSSRSVRGSPRRTDRPVLESPSMRRSYKSSNLSAPRLEDVTERSDYSMDDHDEDTLVSSGASGDSSRAPAPGSFAEQLGKHLAARGRPPTPPSP